MSVDSILALPGFTALVIASVLLVLKMGASNHGEPSRSLQASSASSG